MLFDITVRRGVFKFATFRTVGNTQEEAENLAIRKARSYNYDPVQIADTELVVTNIMQIDPNPSIVRSKLMITLEDGFKYFVTEAGNVVDNLDMDRVDMSWNSIAEFMADNQGISMVTDVIDAHS